MTVDELQQAILAQMAGNGPVTDQMKKTVYDNIWHDSLQTGSRASTDQIIEAYFSSFLPVMEDEISL